MLLFEYLQDRVEELKWKYRYKHRFDKKPIAKCYCKDCDNWNCDSEKCFRLHPNPHTPDEFFCKYAEPKRKDGEDNG